jgi:hypothetical protein
VQLSIGVLGFNVAQQLLSQILQFGTVRDFHWWGSYRIEIEVAVTLWHTPRYQTVPKFYPLHSLPSLESF